MVATGASELTCCFRQACEIEGREHSLGGREYRLPGGTRIAGIPGRVLYLFSNCKKVPLREDSSFSISFDGDSFDGSFISRTDSAIIIALSHDVGPEIGPSTITIEQGDLLSALSRRLGDLPPGFNGDLAARLFEPSRLAREPAFEPVEAPEGLTDEQRDAVRGLSSLEVSFLWGPPGTGKTATLAALVHGLFKENKRVLIVSHTNQAVDNVLEALCRRISGRARLQVPEGSIIRLGPITKEALASSFGEQVEFESVAGRAQLKTAQRLEGLRSDHGKLKEAISKTESQCALARSEQGLLSKLDALREQRRATRPGLFASLRRIFFGWGETRSVVVDETVDLDEEISLVEGALGRIAASLSGVAREGLADGLRELKSQEAEYRQAIAGLEDLVSEMQRGILARARVVATSATRVFLRAEQLERFDVVVIDESSMLPLPVMYLLAGMSSGQVVMAGDFRQLPPISLSSDPLVKEWYSRDIFEAAGITDIVDAGEKHPLLFTLTRQFRSRAEIAEVLNGPFYGGIIKTDYSPELDLQLAGPLSSLAGRCVAVVDTSGLGPIGLTASKSKLNPLHAVLAREVVKALAGSCPGLPLQSFGIVAPYRPQVDLTQELLSEEAIEGVAVGTVHRFQGDERRAIVLDLTESAPHRLGSFLGATSIRETGARLLNVALSRAKELLVILADLPHLRAQLTESHILGRILTKLESDGAVVEAALFTGAGEAQADGPCPLLQPHNRALFLASLLGDLRSAERSGTICSRRLARPFAKIVANVLLTRTSPLALDVVVPPFAAGVSESAEEYASSLEILEQAGCRILTMTSPVCSFALVDEQVAWLGTLDPLACLESDTGTMTRCRSGAIVAALRRFVAVSLAGAPAAAVAANQ